MPALLFFIAKAVGFCYNFFVMEKKVHFYVSRKNVLTWLVALCMLSSAVARIVLVGVKGADLYQPVWGQILLPIVAALLYTLTCLFDGKEHFYKTAIAVWLLSAYHCLSFNAYGFPVLMVALYAIVMLFLAALYTKVTAGRERAPWLLFLVALFPLAVHLYLRHNSLLSGDYEALLPLLPDALVALGISLTVFALRVHPQGEYHPTWGDRTDGRRVRTEPPVHQVSPYIMITRNDSSNYFADSVEITRVERYIRQKRREGLTNFGLSHVLLAAYCRAIAKYPAVNRFISGQRIYSRGEDIQLCLTIKKEMTSSAPDSLSKVHLSPWDTAEDVYRKVNAAVDGVKSTPLDSDFDNTAQLFTMIPGLVLKFTVWVLKIMDYFGIIPKFLLEISPFHGSVFFTSMGSLGVPPIYHHLYDFGNLPIYISFGCKRRAFELQEDGTVAEKKYVDLKFVMDERICDGFYYAAFFKAYKRMFRHPEILDERPSEVVPDIE